MKALAGLATTAAVAALLLTGCAPGEAGSPGGSTSSSGSSHSAGHETTPPATSTSSTSPTAATTPQGELIEITLADGKVTPNGQKVQAKVGDTITLSITSDHDDEIHIHGIDIEIAVKAGEKVVKVITLDQSGSFEVESHHPPKVILILNVR